MGSQTVEVSTKGNQMKSISTIQIGGKITYLPPRNIIDKPAYMSSLKHIGFCNEYINKYVILHRKMLPAYISTSCIEWFKHGNRHNINGPASIFKSGKMHYYLDIFQYTKEEWEVKRRKYLPKEL